MTDLYPFQATAADQISDRIIEYSNEPLQFARGKVVRRIPFIQLLSSITASGKTLILADAVASIAKELPVSPVVLWLSKATVVVEQTYASLTPGGSLNGLIGDFVVRPLADYDATEVSTAADPFLFFATVGTFNQKDKEQGSRRIFKSGIDDATQSTWDSLQLRPDVNQIRRPLIVVYDEAQNLSDQQTSLLLELEPDAFLLATATQRIPRRFSEEIIEILLKVGNKTQEDLTTSVPAQLVAKSGLIKTTIDLVGRQAPMEDVVTEMLQDLQKTEAEAKQFGLKGLPKVVYVCKTNMIEGSDERDNHKRPFAQREAPPILIWRHLTEKLGIDPALIAVYADLKVDKQYPLPSGFVVFNGGDSDYDDFVNGGYRHIIFNQSLQEGWDDPLVYFAYIDKSMGSRIQAEQVVGRLLRQPGRQHYAADRLNTAQIHVRVESAGVFDDVVTSVQNKIKDENVSIKLIKSPPGAKLRKEYMAKATRSVPLAAIITDAAQEPIDKCIATMTDYRHDDGTNTQGIGRTARVQKIVGESGNQAFVWQEVGHSAMVLARWLFAREVRRIYPGALGIALTSSGGGQPSKFDARVGLGSNAAVHIANVAAAVAQAFVEYVFLELRKPHPYVVGPLLQQEEDVDTFVNALHHGYAGLNPDERNFAQALDRVKKLVWCRNPSRTGYGIPLVEPGKTEKFYPDFLVWSGKDVFAIDTKGPHLHSDAMRKLVQIRPADQTSPRVFVRFVSPGLVDEGGAKKDSAGFTVWSFKPNGKRDFTHYDSVGKAVERCLKPDAT
jgi:type III restriction enzyme